MKLLYLSEDYSTSKVHHELIKRLTPKGVNTHVFTVIRLSDRESDIRKTYTGLNYEVSSYVLPGLLEKLYRYIFGFKRRLKLNKLLQYIDPNQFDVIHAATIFSEGIIAYELFKRYHIPYTVAVRGTDLDLYLSKMPHLWSIGRKILLNASNIIFITPILQQKFSEKKPIRELYSELKHKCVIIPNGIEDYWIENQRDKQDISKPDRLLYVGRFDKNKNVERLIEAVLNVRTYIPDIKLNLVGGGDVQHNLIMEYCRKYPNHLHYLGKIYDKDKLLGIMRTSHAFAMVSHSETFGLVYLEALSQGLPILYTSEQGIDGSVPKNVGESANSFSIDDIYNKLLRIMTNYSSYKSIHDSIRDFSWDNIANKYSELYKHIIIK